MAGTRLLPEGVNLLYGDFGSKHPFARFSKDLLPKEGLYACRGDMAGVLLGNGVIDEVSAALPMTRECIVRNVMRPQARGALLELLSEEGEKGIENLPSMEGIMAREMMKMFGAGDEALGF